MVLVRSVRTTGAEASVTAATAAGCCDCQGGPLSTIPAVTPATTIGTAIAAARRRRRPAARSAVIGQARQRRRANLGVQQRSARVRGRLVGRVLLAPGRDLAG